MADFRRLGRTVPDPLPLHRMLTRATPPTLPQAVDLGKYRGPTKDQGDEGSCTGHSFSSGNEWVNRAYLNRAPVLSPQFFYAEELLYDGDFPTDSGSDGNTGCNVIVTKGCCEESLYPYVAGSILQPTAAQLANALLYTLGAYHGLVGSQTALSVLGDPTPWVINIGFTVDDNFQSDEVASNGIYVPSGTSTGGGPRGIADRLRHREYADAASGSVPARVQGAEQLGRFVGNQWRLLDGALGRGRCGYGPQDRARRFSLALESICAAKVTAGILSAELA